jgi:hypothetical protein
MIKEATATLREWTLDWLHLSSTQPAEPTILDPLTIIPRAFAALGAITAVLASPVMNVLVPDLNANAAFFLRLVIAGATLVAVNYVVTKKGTVDSATGFRSQTFQRYRFSNTERIVAQLVVIVGITIWSLNFVPAPKLPKDCEIIAEISWAEPPDGIPTPLYIELTAGEPVRYTVGNGRPVALRVPAAHAASWSLALVWSDNSRSNFGIFTGCSKINRKGSGDGRAQITVQGH